MMNYKESLGKSVKQARRSMKLTQVEAAELAGIDPQTILHIENFRSNTKMSVLFPLIRALHIDPWAVFYPELAEAQDARAELQILLAGCAEPQIKALLPVIRAVLELIKDSEPVALG